METGGGVIHMVAVLGLLTRIFQKGATMAGADERTAVGNSGAPGKLAKQAGGDFLIFSRKLPGDQITRAGSR